MCLIFAFICIYSLYTFAMPCIALLLHIYLTMHYIACPCICTFLCIALHSPAYVLLHACPCILLVSHFTCIKGFLTVMSAGRAKLGSRLGTNQLFPVSDRVQVTILRK